MSLPLRDEVPRELKARVSDKAHWGKAPRLSFDLARIAIDDPSEEATRHPDSKAMRQLFEELRRRELADCQRRIHDVRLALQVVDDSSESEDEAEANKAALLAETEAIVKRGKQVASATFDLAKFRPRMIPIEFTHKNWKQALQVDLRRMRKSGKDCVASNVRVMTQRELAEPEVQEALKLQGVDPNPTDEERENGPAEYWIADCTEYQYEEREYRGGKALRQVGSVSRVCRPCLCPYFRPSDKNTPQCLPYVQFTFGLPWCRETSWCWFDSKGWHTAARMQSTIKRLSDSVGGNLLGHRAILRLVPTKVRWRGGGKRVQPVCHLDPETSLNEMRDALPEATRYQGLPPPETRIIEQHPLELEAHGEEYGLNGHSWEADFYRRALAQGQTDAWIEATLKACEDPDAADAALEAAGKGGAK